MKRLAFFLVLILCCFCRARELNRNNHVLIQAAESWDDKARIPNPRTQSEGGGQELEPQNDVWAELIDLRGMVVEQRMMLRLLTDRVTAAEKQKENSGTMSWIKAIDAACGSPVVTVMEATFTNWAHVVRI